MSTTIRKLAREMADALITRTRDDGSEFVCPRDGAPEWVTDAAHEAHGDMLPEDTRYRMISEVCEALAEADGDGEIEVYEIVAPLVDVYTGKLTAWLASSIHRLGYCEESLDESGTPDSMASLLMIGQEKEYIEIAFALIERFETRVDEQDDTSAIGDEVDS